LLALPSNDLLTPEIREFIWIDKGFTTFWADSYIISLQKNYLKFTITIFLTAKGNHPRSRQGSER
jgi:hypothetical protein